MMFRSVYHEKQALNLEDAFHGEKNIFIFDRFDRITPLALHFIIATDQEFLVNSIDAIFGKAIKHRTMVIYV